MEVHHHPQLHHQPKPWKEYLLEGLMIFIAVAMGFFAESFRENLVENTMEREAIKSYVEDLKSDTAAIRIELLFLREKRMVRVDSLMFLLENKNIKGYENQLYYYGRTLIRSVPYQSNDRTIRQLKNSGTFRVIRNKQAVDSIISYDKLLETLNISQANEKRERDEAKPILSQIFSPFEFDKIVTKNGGINAITRPTDNPPLSSYDPKLQLQLAFSVHMIKGSLYLITSGLEELNAKAKNNITFLKKAYHLENE